MTFNIDDQKSYKTEDTLAAAVLRTFGLDVRYLTVCNRQGRFVAIFPAAWNQSRNAGVFAQRGFLVVG